jgi:hypothetical protein
MNDPDREEKMRQFLWSKMNPTMTDRTNAGQDFDLRNDVSSVHFELYDYALVMSEGRGHNRDRLH